MALISRSAEKPSMAAGSICVRGYGSAGLRRHYASPCVHPRGMPPWRCFRLRAQLARKGGWPSGRLLTMVSDRGATHRLWCINPKTSPPSSQEILPAMPLAPPVGVVIANHNNCAFVEKAVESVARQTVRDLQVIVVDDASTDASDEVIRRCLARLGDTRFRYVKLETNLGQAGALRRGMAEVDTAIGCF